MKETEGVERQSETRRQKKWKNCPKDRKKKRDAAKTKNEGQSETGRVA